jgi:hypothetical protein
MREDAGGRAATTAKVLTLDPSLLSSAAVPSAETPARHNDDDNDDAVARPLVFAPSVGAYAVGGGCASGPLFLGLFLLPFLTTVVNSSASSTDDSAVDREDFLVGRDRARTVLQTAAASVTGGISSLSAISCHHSSALRRSRALRSSSRSRGPEPPDFLVPSPAALSLLPFSPEQRKRLNAGRVCRGGGGEGPMIVPVGAPGEFAFVLLVVEFPTACLPLSEVPPVTALSEHSFVSSTVPWRRLSTPSR